MPTKLPIRVEGEGFANPLGLWLTVALSLVVALGVWGLALHSFLELIGAI